MLPISSRKIHILRTPRFCPIKAVPEALINAIVAKQSNHTITTMGLPMKKRRLHLELSSNSNADWNLQQHNQQRSSSKIECIFNAPQSTAAGIDMLLSAATLTRAARRVSHTDKDMDTSSSPSLLRRVRSAASAQPKTKMHPKTAQVVTCGVCKDNDTNATTTSVSSLYQKMMTDRLSKANAASDQSRLLLSSIDSIMLPPKSEKTSIRQPPQTYHTKKRSRVDRDSKVTSPYPVSASECSSVNDEEDTSMVSSSSYTRETTLQERKEFSSQIQMYAYNELMRRHKERMQYLLEQRNQTMLMLKLQKYGGSK